MSWPIVKLGEILSNAELFTDGDWVESKDQDKFGNVRLIQLADIGDGYYLDKSSRFLNEETFKRLRCTEILSGDILIARMPDPLGRACIFPGDEKKSVTVVDVCIIRPNKQVVDAKWLVHTLNSVSVRKQITGLAKGATRVRISRKDLGTIQLPFPPLPEQKRIAAILDKADELNRKREAAIAKLDQLAQSIFLEMFGDPVNNKKNWKLVKLGDNVEKMGSGSTPTGGDAAYKATGISLIRSLNVHDGEFKLKNLAFIDDLQAKRLANVDVKENDILLNITGASVARVCRAPKSVLPARVNQHVMIIRPNKSINNVFLERLFINDQMKRKLLGIGGAGATREAITKAQANELEIINPPIDLQVEFANRIQQIEQLKADNTAALAKQNNLFASLQQQAFSGQM